MDELFYENYDINDLPGEVWGDYEYIRGHYLVSSLGRVKSTPPKGSWRSDKILCQGLRPNGYLQLRITIDGKRKNMVVHRMVAITHVPNPENKPEVNHKKGIKHDNRASELEWNTRKENLRHAYHVTKVASHKAERNSRATLTNDQALAIYKSGLSTKKLFEKYKVSRKVIRNIKIGASWSTVTGHVWEKRFYLPEKVIDIFKASGAVSEIAKRFGVCIQTVYDIKQGKTFSNVTSEIANKDTPAFIKTYKTPTESEIIEIFKSPLMGKELAEKYGVGIDAVYKIKRGKTFKEVTSKIKTE